jgi:tetratricopeptide (TPR) repeat protein
MRPGEPIVSGRDRQRLAAWRSGQTVVPRQFAPSIQRGLRTGLFQLPPDIEDFTGRDDALRLLQDVFEPSQDRSGNVVVSSIAGRAGVGKTALATRAAHRLRPSFPDGQLYVNLHGAETRQVESGAVLTELLHELGVARGAIPDELDKRSQQYRDQLANRRILVVLDNAAGAEQVRPLLPESPGSAALITSRAQLQELDETTHEILLDVLDQDQAIELLTKIVGAQHVDAEPKAARKIVQLCNHLPLAIRIAGAQLPSTSHTPKPLAVLAKRLESEQGRLGALSPDVEVRASFALNYRSLEDAERRAFRLLGLLKAPEFSAWVVTALLDADLIEAEQRIERLVKAEMLEVAQETPSGQVRYRFHDLLRACALERVWIEEPQEDWRSALSRLLETYLALARYASELLEPQDVDHTGITAPPPRLADVVARIEEDPATWFEDERTSLVATVELASEYDLRDLTWELARSLTYFFKLRSHWTQWQHTQQLALRAARVAKDRPATANALRSLGDAYAQLQQFQLAVDHFEQALTLFGTLEDRRRKAWTHVGLGNAYWEQGAFAQAVEQFQPALELFATSDVRGQAWAREGLAVAYRLQGRFDDCIDELEKALTLFVEVEDRRGQAYCLVNHGTVRRDRGQLPEALDWFEQAQPIFEDLADRHGATYVLLNKGHLLREQHRHEEASALLEECLTAFLQLGDRVAEAWTRFNRGMVYQAQEALEQADEELEHSSSLFQELNHPRGAAWTSIGMGAVHLARGSSAGLEHFEAAAAELKKLKDRLGLAKALKGSGQALALAGDRTAAAQRWQAALELFNELGASEVSEVKALLARS